VDGIVAQVRAIAEHSPDESLVGWLSDFSKAYKQIPGDPQQLRDVVIAQYDPTRNDAAYFVPLCLVFGSKTAPLDFARFPAVMCEMVARLFRLPATHCVDDVIFVETALAAPSGKLAWTGFVKHAGWLMSKAKEVEPSNLFNAIGISVDLRQLPSGAASVLVTKRRVQSLRHLIRSILTKGKLGPGEAASLAGKLGFTISATFGRFGRCRMKPIFQRAHSRAKNLKLTTPVCSLTSCLWWWLAFLNDFKPRPIPASLSDLPCIISYSDGEGGLAGIGAAVWDPRRPKPLALYTEVPDFMRDKWQMANSNNVRNDIFFVEALGPLLLLIAFPNVLKDCLWIHFIDNTAAEASLIRGSSSVEGGDHIVGLTWTMIQKQRLWAYFDRVESKANPVDGLSRRRFSGPWDQVYRMDFPAFVLDEFVRSFGR